MREKGAENRAALSWLREVAGREKWEILLLLLVQAVLGLSGVGNALLLRGLIDAAVAERGKRFWENALLLAGLVLFQIMLRAVNRFLEEHTRSVMENRCKERLFSGLLQKDYASVMAIHSGEWMNRLTSDTVVVADGLVQILPGVAGMAARMVGAVAALLALKPQFCYIIVPGGMLLMALTWFFRKVLKRLHKRIQEADGALRTFFQERLGSQMVVRAFAQEKQAVAQSMELMAAHKAARIRRSHFSNLCNIGFGTAMNGAYVFGAIFCGYGILNGTMSYGTFMAVLQLISQIQNPFANISGYLPKYYAMLASAERLMEAEAFAEDCPEDEIAEDEIRRFYRESFAGLGLRKARFAYQPPVRGEGGSCPMPILAGVEFRLRKGEYVALTGPSGCGKSTVLKLLLSLYPLDEGERYLMTENGECPLTAAWRGLFAYVPQGNQLLSGTVREIVAFGDTVHMREDEQLHQALKIACADEFVAELEQGMDTALGERGTGLSEGQMQRLAIARAIFSGRPILLLDEATSALDEATEAKLLLNLRAMTDRTVLIVTHRPAARAIVDKTIDFSQEGRKRQCRA